MVLNSGPIVDGRNGLLRLEAGFSYLSWRMYLAPSQGCWIAPRNSDLDLDVRRDRSASWLVVSFLSLSVDYPVTVSNTLGVALIHTSNKSVRGSSVSRGTTYWCEVVHMILFMGLSAPIPPTGEPNCVMETICSLIYSWISINWPRFLNIYCDLD